MGLSIEAKGPGVSDRTSGQAAVFSSSAGREVINILSVTAFGHSGLLMFETVFLTKAKTQIMFMRICISNSEQARNHGEDSSIFQGLVG